MIGAALSFRPVIRGMILLLALALPAAAQSDSAARRPTAGFFSADQAARGEGVFKAFCATCHEPTFHSGDAFRSSWYGRTLLDYFRNVKATMPQDNPGGLSDDDYVRVITYMLKLNGFRAGADSLKADTVELGRIRMAAPPHDSATARRPF